MAARETQGTQAVIITLGVLSFILLGLLIWQMNERKKAQAASASAATDLNSARTAQAQLQDEANSYKMWMGFNEGDAKAALDAAFKQDMERFGASLAEESRAYRTILDNTFEENRKLALNEANAKAQIKELNDRLLAVESQKEAQVKKIDEEMKKVAADAAAEKAKFDEQYATINADKENIAKQLQEKQDQIDELQNELRTQRADYDAKAVKLERSITKLREGLPEVDQFAQPADGRITWVSQKYQNVWVDLGADDGLRPQVTFSVAAAGLGDAETAEKKGSIEVIRIIGPHMAEARITHDDPTNPLAPGDRIYSQVWDRGRKVGFGIAGFVDIDGNGTSDLDKLKDIIVASNGRVDAAPDAKGGKTGEMKVDSRFLVLGEFPDDPHKAAYRASWEELGAEAEALGVQTIALGEFLKLMGWQVDTRTVPLTGGARPSDFPPRGYEVEAPGTRPASSDVLFKRRLPPGGY